MKYLVIKPLPTKIYGINKRFNKLIFIGQVINILGNELIIPTLPEINTMSISRDEIRDCLKELS